MNCADAHDVQMIDEVVLTGPTFWDEAGVGRDIDEKCEAAFERFAAPYDGSALQLQQIWPGESNWIEGLRDGDCLISHWSDGRRLVGTAQWSMW